MGQVKIYPATQTQAQTIINKIDAVDAKIVAPTYQAKIVTPTTAQQLIEPDNGYDALSSVTVNPAQTTDLENWISRNDQQEPIYLELTTDMIASYACYGQSRLVSFRGDNVTSIESNAFSYCTSLQTVDVRSVTSIGSNAFSNCTSLQTVDVRSVTSIGVSAFNNCTSLQTVDVRSVTSIANYVFSYCTSLQTVDVRSVTSIGTTAFSNCTSLQTVDVRSVTSIGVSAFNNCTSLQTVDVRSVTSIATTAFGNCTSLRLVDCTSCTTPPTIQSNTFSGSNNSFKVVVATDTEKALFQAATNWSARASQIYTVAEIEALVGMTYDEYYLQCFGHARSEVTE